MSRSATSRRKIASVLPAVKPHRQPEGAILVDRSLALPGLLTVASFALACTGLSLLLFIGGLRSGNAFGAFCALIWIGGVAVYLLFISIRQLRIYRRLAAAELLISRWPLRMGEQADVRFRQRLKRPTAVRRINGRLCCKEVASYRSGKSTSSEEQVLYAEPLPPVVPPPGSLTLEALWRIRIPHAGPPSLAVPHNRIQWQVEVDLDISGAPSDTVGFEIIVLPEVLPL